MSKDQETLLKRAIIQGVSERYAYDLSVTKKSICCSENHLQRMSEILGFDVQKAQKVRKRRMIAATIILAAALAIGSLTVYSYREQIRDFLIQVFEEYIVLEFEGDQTPATIEQHYQVGYMPEGYTLTKELHSVMDTKYEWENEIGQTITFAQGRLNTEFRYDGEHGSATEIEHNGLRIWCKENEGAMSYTWNDGKYAMHIYDRTMLPLEEILMIIDSIS